MRLLFEARSQSFFDEFEMVKEQLITNEKTGEELSLSIIDNGHKRIYHYYGVITECVIEIKRKRIVSKAAKKNVK